MTILLTEKEIVTSWEGKANLRALAGMEVRCRGEGRIQLTVKGSTMKVQSIVFDEVVNSVNVVLGMDVIVRLVGVTVGDKGLEFKPMFCVV